MYNIIYTAFNLNTVLKKTQAGVQLIEYYEREKELNRDDMKELVRLIVDRLMCYKSKLGLVALKEVANQISLIFTNEDKVL